MKVKVKPLPKRIKKVIKEGEWKYAKVEFIITIPIRKYLEELEIKPNEIN